MWHPSRPCTRFCWEACSFVMPSSSRTTTRFRQLWAVRPSSFLIDSFGQLSNVRSYAFVLRLHCAPSVASQLVCRHLLCFVFVAVVLRALCHADVFNVFAAFYFMRVLELWGLVENMRMEFSKLAKTPTRKVLVVGTCFWFVRHIPCPRSHRAHATLQPSVLQFCWLLWRLVEATTLSLVRF